MERQGNRRRVVGAHQGRGAVMTGMTPGRMPLDLEDLARARLCEIAPLPGADDPEIVFAIARILLVGAQRSWNQFMAGLDADNGHAAHLLFTALDALLIAFSTDPVGVTARARETRRAWDSDGLMGEMLGTAGVSL